LAMHPFISINPTVKYIIYVHHNVYYHSLSQPTCGQSLQYALHGSLVGSIYSGSVPVDTLGQNHSNKLHQSCLRFSPPHYDFCSPPHYDVCSPPHYDVCSPPHYDFCSPPHYDVCDALVGADWSWTPAQMCCPGVQLYIYCGRNHPGSLHCTRASALSHLGLCCGPHATALPSVLDVLCSLKR